MGVAYDVFGNGKTAMKVNFSKYLQPANNEGNFIIRPTRASTFQTTTTRTWSDSRRQQPDSSGLRSARTRRQRRVRPVAEPNFGNPPTRPASTRTCIEGGASGRTTGSSAWRCSRKSCRASRWTSRYNRRWWGNFYVTDNQALGPSDYDAVHDHGADDRAKLPHGGGSRVTFLKRNANSPLARRQLLHVRQRLRRRDLLLAGHRLQRQRADDATAWCCRAASAPARGAPRPLRGEGEAARAAVARSARPQQIERCTSRKQWLMNWRGLVTYTIPKVDVLVSGILRSQANTRAVASRPRGHQRRRRWRRTTP